MALLCCQSPKCCGHEMSYEQMLADIRRWPRVRMVSAPPRPPCRRRRVSRIAPTDKRAALARIKAGVSVANVAAAMGVSRAAVYKWRAALTAPPAQKEQA